MYQAQPDRLATLQSLYLELHMQPLYTITSHILLLTTNFIGDVSNRKIQMADMAVST